jgi:hypothetical protein
MKIKIDKKIWLIAVIVVFVIAAAFLLRMYSQQANDQAQLRTSLASRQTLLHKLTNDKATLEDQLEQADSLLNTSQAEFPESVESIEYGEDLFEIAESCNLELTDLNPTVPTNIKAGAVTYSVGSFAIVVSGSMDDIIEFVEAIRTGDGFDLPWSAEIESISINAGTQGTTATITLDIYGYER